MDLYGILGLYGMAGEEREWVPSDPHSSRSTLEGGRHFDVYHVDSDGKRDQGHDTDYKISGDPHSPSMTDIHKA